MKKDIIYSHSLDAGELEIKKSEILRYMGQRCEDERIDRIIDSLVGDAKKSSRPKACFVLKDLRIEGEKIHIADMEIKSKSLMKNLSGCEMAILIVFTLGTDTDRFIESNLTASSVQGVCADAISTALCEEYADRLCGELEEYFKKDGFTLMPRFSAGYGDFGLEYQKDFIRCTEAMKRCGVSVTDALMLVPTKSVSAIIGLKGECNI